MSRFKERREKTCLNCNAEVQGRFCHNCGQENIEPKESVWHLITHFFQDITHFDGKFFSTVKYLVTRPGFLSREYMLGRRASYVNPIRMYIFTSAFFFLLFFTFFKPVNKDLYDLQINKKTLSQIAQMDSTTFADFTRDIHEAAMEADKPMTRIEFERYIDTAKRFNNFEILGSKYKTREQYDSALKAGKKHNWLQRKIFYQAIDLNAKYKGNSRELLRALGAELLHSLPQMLFISLPLLALLLKLLYVRRKQYYYVSHGIFSLHLYIFVFIALLFQFALIKINTSLNWGLITTVNVLLFFGLFFYEYKAMRNFYQQRRAKTIFKFLVLNFLFLFTMTLLFLSFFLLSLFKL